MSQRFTATTNVITGPNTAFPTTGSLSVMWYPEFAQGDGLNHIVFEIGEAGFTSFFQIIKGAANTFQANWCVSGTTYSANASAGTYVLTQNAWNNVVVTWTTSGAMTLYLNGTQIGNNPTIGTYATAATWAIGARNTGGVNFDCRGRLGQLGIWNAVISGANITSLGNQTSTPADIQTNLRYHYLWFGTQLTDAQGNGVTLTTNGTSSAADPTTGPTVYLTGPSGGPTGQASTNFTLTGAHLPFSEQVTLATNSSGGFSNGTPSLSVPNGTATSTYTANTTTLASLSITTQHGFAVAGSPIGYTSFTPQAGFSLAPDNAESKLASGYTAGGGSIALTSGDGPRFDDPIIGAASTINPGRITIVKAANKYDQTHANRSHYTFTGRSGDTLSGLALADGFPVGGTVAVTNGSPSVVGTGTTFTTRLLANDLITFVSDPTQTKYTVLSITDNTHLTLTATYGGSTAASTTAFWYRDQNFSAGDFVQANATGGLIREIQGRVGSLRGQVVSLKDRGVDDTAVLTAGTTSKGALDSAPQIQQVLNLAATGVPLTVLWDVRCGIGSKLYLYSNTTIIATDGAGAVMRDNSNTCMFQNSTLTFGVGPIPVVHGTGTPIDVGNYGNANITIKGGIWIGNGKNQGTPDADNPGAFPSNLPLNFVRFMGVQHAVIQDCQVYAFGGFGVWLVNCYDIELRNLHIDYTDPTNGQYSLGNDCLHIAGPCKRITFRDSTVKCSDDAISITADDASLGGAPNPSGSPLQYTNAGNIDDVVCDRIFADAHQRTLIRVLSTKSRANDIRFSRLTGSAGAIYHDEDTGTCWLTGSGNIGNVYFDDINVKVITASFDKTAGWYHSQSANLLSFRRISRQTWDRTWTAIVLDGGTTQQVFLDSFSEYDTANPGAVLAISNGTVNQCEISNVQLRYSAQVTNPFGIGTAGVCSWLALHNITADKCDYILVTVPAMTGSVIASGILHTNSTQTASFNFGSATPRFTCSNWDGPGTTVYAGTAPTSRAGDAFVARF